MNARPATQEEMDAMYRRRDPKFQGASPADDISFQQFVEENPTFAVELLDGTVALIGVNSFSNSDCLLVEISKLREGKLSGYGEENIILFTNF